MTRDMRAAALALHRFGLGPRAGSIEAIASDPQRALIGEFERPGAGLVAAADLPSSGAANRAVFEYNESAMRRTSSPADNVRPRKSSP
jgi:uncharacterized protein (DUF1800 family)